MGIYSYSLVSWNVQWFWWISIYWFFVLLLLFSITQGYLRKFTYYGYPGKSVGSIDIIDIHGHPWKCMDVPWIWTDIHGHTNCHLDAQNGFWQVWNAFLHGGVRGPVNCGFGVGLAFGGACRPTRPSSWVHRGLPPNRNMSVCRIPHWLILVGYLIVNDH